MTRDQATLLAKVELSTRVLPSAQVSRDSLNRCRRCRIHSRKFTRKQPTIAATKIARADFDSPRAHELQNLLQARIDDFVVDPLCEIFFVQDAKSTVAGVFRTHPGSLLTVLANSACIADGECC